MKLLKLAWFPILVCASLPVITQAAMSTVGSPPARIAAPAAAAVSLKRALVIGNGAYTAGALENATADATLMADVLKKIGFAVTLAKNLSRAGMFDAVRAYAASLPPGAISVVYFAGHGMQLDGVNFLIPVDMVPTGPASVSLKSFPLKVLHEQLASAKSSVNLIVLDSCRNNPFEPAPAVRLRSFRALGLAATAAPRGTLIAYSTAPGQQAADGTGRRHSLYTQTLASLLEQGGMPAEELFKTVADRVRRISLEDQQPWYESSLVGTVDLAAPVEMPSATPATRATQPMLAGHSRSMPATAPGPGGKGKASIGHEGDAAWFRNMNELEWTELDNEMTLRAENVSADQIPTLQKQAANNNVVAMTTLAMALRAGTNSGINVNGRERFRFNPNMGKALTLYRKAAALGFPVAQAELAEILYLGREAEKNRPEALRLVALAAQAQYPRAKIDLAQIKLESSGQVEDTQDLMRLMFGSTETVRRQARERTSP